MITNSTVYQRAQQVVRGETNNDYIFIGVDGSKKLYKAGERKSEDIDHIYCFAHGYISDKLTISKVSKIFAENYSAAMMIDAQTGAGKTTLITEVFYPIVKFQGKRMLILSNRKLIKSKIKYDIIKAVSKEILELLTPKGIEQEHHFGNVDIYSYQDFMGDFPYKRNREEFEKTLSEYGVVVFDEVHFAISDAGFNVYTAEIMDYLLERVMKYKNTEGLSDRDSESGFKLSV